jgi:hypothetical protein
MNALEITVLTSRDKIKPLDNNKTAAAKAKSAFNRKYMMLLIVYIPSLCK